MEREAQRRKRRRGVKGRGEWRGRGEMQGARGRGREQREVAVNTPPQAQPATPQSKLTKARGLAWSP